MIVFHSLNKDNLKQIVDIELSKVRGRLADRGLELVLTDEAKEFLIDKGFNPDYGARPLRRAIENIIEDPLSEALLRGEFKGKDTIRITAPLGAESKTLGYEGVNSKEGSPAAPAAATADGAGATEGAGATAKPEEPRPPEPALAGSDAT